MRTLPSTCASVLPEGAATAIPAVATTMTATAAAARTAFRTELLWLFDVAEEGSRTKRRRGQPSAPSWRPWVADAGSPAPAENMSRASREPFLRSGFTGGTKWGRVG